MRSMMVAGVLAQAPVPQLDPAAGQRWIPHYSRVVEALSGLMLAGLLMCAGAVILGGATWWVSSTRAPHSAAITMGRLAVIAGFVGAICIGAARVIVNTGFQLGS